ncbi:MAG TPA: M48 family metallopeptidase [Terriglobales bacterium]|nr:M48 family metallopeptidase [Terriglobales bacterium]
MKTGRAVSMLLMLFFGTLLGAQVRFTNAPDLVSSLAAVAFHQSPADLPGISFSFFLPRVTPPARHLDPKYDLTKIGNRNIGAGLDFYSLEREIEMGRQLAQEVEANSRVVEDPVINAYINRLGQRLVANSDARVPFEIKVLQDDEVNAFALPGGFFFVNTGLIEAADNEAGLAGVMAHEIAHVAARHATKNATRNEIFNLASIPLIMFGGPAALAVREAMGVAVPIGVLKFSRDAEREADFLGLQYDYETGYDPQEFVKLFEKFKTDEKGKHSFIAKAFSTHPMTGDRIKRAQNEIERYLPPRTDYVVDTSDFEEIKARVIALDNRYKIDAGFNGHPTLIQRDAGQEPTDTSSKSDSNPPVLHRK